MKHCSEINKSQSQSLPEISLKRISDTGSGGGVACSDGRPRSV